MTPRSGLSVVVIALGGQSDLRRCLTELVRQVDPPARQIVVPCDDRLRDLSALRGEFPAVEFLTVEGRHTYAELRARAIRECQGGLVAITEDHCDPAPDWCAQIVQAHARLPQAAIGGAVEKGPDGALNWAVYLCDYGRYMNPVREGRADYLTDCNVSYKRGRLEAIAGAWAEEFHEPVVHAALQAQGDSLWLTREIVVHEKRRLGLGEALYDRYAFGRLFASTRPSAAKRAQRVLFAALALGLPPLSIGRTALNVLQKGRHRARFIQALPAMLLLTSVWAGGEFTGYLTGRPEKSLSPE